MRNVSALLAVLLVAACAGADDAPETVDSAAPDTPIVSTPQAAAMADFAGTWQSEAVLEGVAEPVLSTMSGSASGTDWTMTFPGRPPIPLSVRIEGDSLISESAEYESILRPGVRVTVRTASVLTDGMLMGNLLATYRTAQGEERVPGTVHSTRTQ
jgi:hypothetical protein